MNHQHQSLPPPTSPRPQMTHLIVVSSKPPIYNIQIWLNMYMIILIWFKYVVRCCTCNPFEGCNDSWLNLICLYMYFTFSHTIWLLYHDSKGPLRVVKQYHPSHLTSSPLLLGQTVACHAAGRFAPSLHAPIKGWASRNMGPHGHLPSLGCRVGCFGKFFHDPTMKKERSSMIFQ